MKPKKRRPRSKTPRRGEGRPAATPTTATPWNVKTVWDEICREQGKDGKRPTIAWEQAAMQLLSHILQDEPQVQLRSGTYTVPGSLDDREVRRKFFVQIEDLFSSAEAKLRRGPQCVLMYADGKGQSVLRLVGGGIGFGE